MIAPIACDALWRATHSERLNVLWQWTLFALLAVGAACLNPDGPEMILVTFRTVVLGAALTTVTEWRPQDFTHLGAFEVIMLGAFGFALYRGVTLPGLRIVMVVGVLHLSLSQCVTPTCLECAGRYSWPGLWPNNSRRSPATAVALLDRLPDWKRVYSDDVAVVHVRR
jgi:hypothetical protein